MLDLRKLFQQQEEPPVPDTQFETRDELRRSIGDGYRDLIVEQLRRGGVDVSCVDIDVKHIGLAPDKRPVYLGMLRLARWERRSALRLLLGLPILEAKLRRLARISWLHDVSQFGGLWLHASGQLQDTPAMQELRSLVMDIERNDRASASESTGPWSLPTDLGKLE